MSAFYENAAGLRAAQYAEIAAHIGVDDGTCPNCRGGSSPEFPCHDCDSTGRICTDALPTEES